MNGLGNISVGEIVAKSPEKIEVFRKYGIDFCCGGDKTLGEACDALGINQTVIARELETLKADGSDKKPEGDLALIERALDWDIDFLIDYIINNHHVYLRKKLPEASEYVQKIASVHGKNHSELIKIRHLFVEKMAPDLLAHLDREEEKFFPTIKFYSNSVSGSKEKGTVGNYISEEMAKAKEDHEIQGRVLKELEFLSSNFAVPRDACASYRHAYKLLSEITEDIMVHVHLENNILFRTLSSR